MIQQPNTMDDLAMSRGEGVAGKAPNNLYETPSPDVAGTHNPLLRVHFGRVIMRLTLPNDFNIGQYVGKMEHRAMQHKPVKKDCCTRTRPWQTDCEGRKGR